MRRMRTIAIIALLAIGPLTMVGASGIIAIGVTITAIMLG
jgi:hypothetical protein